MSNSAANRRSAKSSRALWRDCEIRQVSVGIKFILVIEMVAHHIFGVRNPCADHHDSRWPLFFRMAYAEIISLGMMSIPMLEYSTSAAIARPKSLMAQTDASLMGLFSTLMLALFIAVFLFIHSADLRLSASIPP